MCRWNVFLREKAWFVGAGMDLARYYIILIKTLLVAARIALKIPRLITTKRRAIGMW